MAISYGTYTITEVQEGSQIWTSSVAPSSPNYTFTISNLTGDSETSVKAGDIIMYSYYRYTVLSVSADGTTVLAGNRVSIGGETYSLIVSNLAIVKDKNGDISPTSITLTAKSQTGSSAMANYAGRFKIESTTDNSTWTTQYTSSANEATKTWNVISNIVAIRCSLYLKDGTTTLLDQQTIPIVSDGIDGTDGTNGADAYTVILTNENHTFTGNTTSALASEIECNVIAYKGATQVASTIGTITGQPTGMTTSLSNNGTTNASFTVAVTTNMVTKNGVLNIPITVDGKNFTKKFTYSLALKGISGTSENLLMDVYASSLTKVDAPWNRYLSDASNSTITGQFIAESNLPDPNATHFYRITDSSATTKGRGLCFYSGSTPPFITGHTYRIGCWVRKHDGSPKIQITIGSYGSWMPVHKRIENTGWEWFEVVHTFGETDASKTTQSDTYKRIYFYFYNNNVAGSSLDMCGFKMEEVQVNSGTARNFILGTEKLADWTTTQGATIFNGVVTFPDVTANIWREACSAKSFKYDLIRNQYVIFSIKVKADSDKKCRFYLNVSVDNDETTHIRQKYFDQYIYFIGDGEWQTVCLAVPVFDYMFNSGSGTIDFNDCWVTIRFGAANNYWNGFQAKEPQLSLGTTATSWTPAPEDIDADIEDARKVATNYLAVDNTGIMIADMEDGEQTPSGILTGKNVFIDSNSVEIRDGQNTLSSFGSNSVVLGQEGKSRLELSSTEISGIADDGTKNFIIMNGDSQEERTITRNGTFENTSIEDGKFDAFFNITEEFYYFHNITITVTFNYTWDNQLQTSNPLTININDPVEDETIVVWGISETELHRPYYTLNTYLDCNIQHINNNMTTLYARGRAEIIPNTTGISYEMGSIANYSITIETKTYQNASYTFGSRVVNSTHGANSFAIGEGLVASSDNQIAIGRYNNDALGKNYAFMIGNGIYGESRTNAFTVDWNGRTEMGDIQGYGLQLLENSQSEMDNYIECIDVNDDTVFNVSKTGVVDAIGRINAPNVKLQKESTNNADYIQCQDENNNVNFRVLNNGSIATEGTITSTGDVVVGGAETVNGNLYAKGRLLYDSTSSPLFKVVTKTIDNISIGANGSSYPSVDVNESGYTPIAISSVTLGSASNGGTTYGYSIVQSTGINGQTLNFYVGNWNTSSAAKIKLVIKVLCIRSSAL